MMSNRVIGSADVPARETFRVALAAWSVIAALVTVRYGALVGWPLLGVGWATIAATVRVGGRLLSTGETASDRGRSTPSTTGSRP